MPRATYFSVFLLAGLCAIALSCTEEPTGSSSDGLRPNLGHNPNHPFNTVEQVPLKITFRDGAGDKISSDKRFADATYVHDECGVRADFPPSGSGDATFNPDQHPIKGFEAERCGGRQPRFIVLDLTSPVGGADPGPVLQEGAFMNVHQIQQIAVGSTVFRTALFATSFCRLKFNPSLGGDELKVTRLSESTWTVETQAAPSDRAFCDDGSGRGYHMPFQITVTIK